MLLGAGSAALLPVALAAGMVAQVETLAITVVLRGWRHDHSLVVLADRDRILQALGNLVANAFKCTPRGGRVTLSVAREDGRARFSVEDTGPGIAPAHVSRLFDQFWQGNAADKRGIGLGLSIVRGIAEGHGGQARVETVPGHGSTFSVLLPLLLQH